MRRSTRISGGAAWRLAALCGAALGASACQPPTPPPPSLADAPSFERRIAVLRCAVDVRCGAVPASMQADCEREVIANMVRYREVPSLRTYGYDLLEAVARERVAYDPAQAGSCALAWQSTGCTADEVARTQRICARVYRGVAHAGAGCTDTDVLDECDGACDRSTCPSLCVARQPIGAPCAYDADCVRAAYCDTQSRRCLARLASGMRGAPCHGLDSCAIDTVCMPIADGTCVSPGRMGQPCESWGARTTCEPGLRCSPISGLCELRASAGTTCTAPDACADGLTCAGLGRSSLAPVGRCTAIADVGAPCVPGAVVTGCARGLRCDDVTGTCAHAFRYEGQTCSLRTGDSVCASWPTRPDSVWFWRLRCSSAAVCEHEPGLGDECSPDGVLSCRDGGCDPRDHRCVVWPCP